MNLKEIVNRTDNHVISTEEALFVIKEYIKIHKGVYVNPVIELRHGNIKEILRLKRMADIAISWIRSNI